MNDIKELELSTSESLLNPLSNGQNEVMFSRENRIRGFFKTLLETGPECVVVGRVLDHSRLLTKFLPNLLTIFQLWPEQRN